MYKLYERLRNEKGWKDADIVKKTGIGQGVFSDWKNGRYTPKIDKLQKIADALSVPVEYLTTGKFPAKESRSATPYYFDDASAERAQAMYQRKEMRDFFDAVAGLDSETVKLLTSLVERLKTPSKTF